MAALFIWWFKVCAVLKVICSFYNQVREEGNANMSYKLLNCYFMSWLKSHEEGWSFTAKPKLLECLFVSYQCLRGNGMVQVVAFQILHPLQNGEVQEEVMKFSLTSYEHLTIFFPIVQPVWMGENHCLAFSAGHHPLLQMGTLLSKNGSCSLPQRAGGLLQPFSMALNSTGPPPHVLCSGNTVCSVQEQKQNVM